MDASASSVWCGIAVGVLILLCGAFGWPVARRVGPALAARFDREALCVESPQAPVQPADPLNAAQQAAWPRLLAWCLTGAGDGRSPFWRPWVAPRVDARFTVAMLTGEPAGDLAPLAEAFSRHIDGSDQLAAVGGLSGLLLRLRVKRDDAVWWRARRPSDLWDSGYLVADALDSGALGRFRPRRPTLIVAPEGLPPEVVHRALAVLGANQALFQQPVRLLLVGAAPVAALQRVTVIRCGR